MREQPGPGRLHDERLRCAVQGKPFKKHRIDRQTGCQGAIDTRGAARAVIIRVKRNMSAMRGFARRLVTGWHFARRSGGLCHASTGQLPARLRQGAIGRAGDGKGKHDKTGD